MRAAVLRAPKTITIEERPEPVPGDDEVIVKVVSVGVCGSDVHYYEDGRIGSFIVEAPLILGHEAAGEVVALGKSARRHAVGDRVSIEPGVPDRSCMVTGRYPLEETGAALTAGLLDPASIKPIVTPHAHA